MDSCTHDTSGDRQSSSGACQMGPPSTIHSFHFNDLENTARTDTGQNDSHQRLLVLKKKKKSPVVQHSKNKFIPFILLSHSKKMHYLCHTEKTKHAECLTSTLCTTKHVIPPLYPNNAQDITADSTETEASNS